MTKYLEFSKWWVKLAHDQFKQFESNMNSLMYAANLFWESDADRTGTLSVPEFKNVYDKLYQTNSALGTVDTMLKSLGMFFLCQG